MRFMARVERRSCNKVALISGAYDERGVRREIRGVILTLSVEMMKQTAWYEAYK